MNKRGLFTSALVCFVFLAFLSPAQGDISTIYPSEGTLGTKFTVYGSGFGEKRGKVLLGNEKCKVLDWRDTEIECLITKAQPSADYTVTVIHQGNKKHSEPMTFSSFAMRKPRIFIPHDPQLVLDGNTIKITGAFFGDKKGEVSYENVLGQTETAKILDWGMDCIRFEIPGVMPEAFMLRVVNEVGEDERLLNLNSPPGAWGDIAIDTARNNSSGIYYNSIFYVFLIRDVDIFHKDWRIEFYWYDNQFDNHYFWPVDDAPIPEGYTEAQVVPLVIQGKLWVFCTGRDGIIHYAIYSSPVGGYFGEWETSSWQHVPDVVTDRPDWEIAPVYNPVAQRIEVYYMKNSALNWIYSTDLGATWQSGGQIVSPISKPPSVLFYQGAGFAADDYVMLVATGDSEGNLVVHSIRDGELIETATKSDYSGLPFGLVSGRPYLYNQDYLTVDLIWRDSDGNFCKCEKLRDDNLWYGILKYDYDIIWPPNAAGSLDGFYYFNGIDWNLGKIMAVMYLYFY
jgi:IPT/TIG domain